MKKKNKVLIITSIVFVVFALVFLILGFALSGVDILAWFTSKWAYMFYAVGAVYLIIVITIVVGDLIRKI